MDLGIHASYYHKLTENQTLGVELEGKGAQGEAVSTVGYSFDIPGADCNIKGEVKFLFLWDVFLDFTGQHIALGCLSKVSSGSRNVKEFVFSRMCVRVLCPRNSLVMTY